MLNTSMNRRMNPAAVANAMGGLGEADAALFLAGLPWRRDADGLRGPSISAQDLSNWLRENRLDLGELIDQADLALSRATPREVEHRISRMPKGLKSAAAADPDADPAAYTALPGVSVVAG